MKRKRSSPGMFTVEMAIIFPVIFLTLVGLMYIGIVHYQNTVTQTAAMRTASRVAYSWDALGNSAGAWGFQLNEEARAAEDAPAEGQLVGFSYTDHDPYDAIVDGSRSTREANALAYFKWLLDKNPSLLGEGGEETSGAKVEKQFSFLQSFVTVSVEKHYINPMGHLLEQIGIAAEQDSTITAKAPVNDPVEFVRLVGLIREFATD